jgi:hypothetical protein
VTQFAVAHRPHFQPAEDHCLPLIARRLAPQAWQASAQSHSARDRHLRKRTKGH